MQLAEFNALPLGHAAAELATCCSSPEWARCLARARPFDPETPYEAWPAAAAAARPRCPSDARGKSTLTFIVRRF